jgi:hypothetical protein
MNEFLPTHRVKTYLPVLLGHEIPLHYVPWFVSYRSIRSTFNRSREFAFVTPEDIILIVSLLDDEAQIHHSSKMIWSMLYKIALLLLWTLPILAQDMHETCSADDGTCPAVVCEDTNDLCEFWAAEGECNANPTYMRANCSRSCKVCSDQT